MAKPGTHIPFHPEITPKLDSFAKSRGRPKTKIIHSALKQFFELEEADAHQNSAFREAIDRKFSVPASIPHRSFFLFLYMLAKQYPRNDSRSFWTNVVYRSSIPKTHGEVFAELQADYGLLLNGHGKKD